MGACVLLTKVVRIYKFYNKIVTYTAGAGTAAVATTTRGEVTSTTFQRVAVVAHSRCITTTVVSAAGWRPAFTEFRPNDIDAAS